MIDKKFKLISSKEISFVLKSRFRFKCKYFDVLLVKNTFSHNRFLIIVSKKIYKKANLRNKIRRKIYLALQNYLAYAKFDCIILIKNKEILHLNKNKLQLEINKSFNFIFNKVFKSKNLTNPKLTFKK